MIKLIKNADIYAPEHLGLRDLLIAGDKIESIFPAGSETFSMPKLEVIDLNGKKLAPGFIDIHVHITGGGGEQGFASRVPEAKMEEIAKSGVTTVLGMLGTDGITRSLENLYAKTVALNEEGLTAYMLTGSYAIPSVTMTGSITKDIAMLDRCIGLKAAMSDHRSSHPDARMLTDAAAEARMGGLISGKKGLFTLHMGSGKAGLSPIFEMLEESEVPIGNLLPTHMGRNDELWRQGLRFIEMGGAVDLTGGDGKAAKRILSAIHRGLDESKITISSDGYGSQPKFDAQGNCIGLSWSKTDLLHEELCALYEMGLPLSEALQFITVNPADRLGLSGVKGRLAEGYDADMVVLGEDLAVEGVIAKGKTLVWNGENVAFGYFH